MKRSLYRMAAAFAASVLLLSACKQEDEYNISEGYKITTVLLRLTAPSGFDSTYIYKVNTNFGENGVGIRSDTIALPAGDNFNMSVALIDESKSPHDDITTEINAERNSHLFLYQSEPVSGPGSVAFSDGQRDFNNNAYNITGRLTTGARGNGKLRFYLVHLPVNKAAGDPSGAGGTVEVEAFYNVVLY